jgi:cyclophilin family peptidyl-prolyl cis-trans isomerase
MVGCLALQKGKVMKTMRWVRIIGVLLASFCIPLQLRAQMSPGDSTIDLNIRYIGTLRLELFDQDKPASVHNFLTYVLSGAYSNNFIHYTSSNFVFQGGSLRIIDLDGGGQAVVPVTENAPVTNELGIGRFFSNVRGTIALAHYSGETNNATCHWFINLVDNPSLDAPDTNHAYVVFGRVISGLTNLDKLNPTATNTSIKILDLGGWLTECPVNPSATLSTVTYDDLLTVSYNLVTLNMELQVQRVATNTILAVIGSTPIQPKRMPIYIFLILGCI